MDLKWEKAIAWTPPSDAGKTPTWRVFAIRMFLLLALTVVIFVLGNHSALRAHSTLKSLSAAPLALFWLSSFITYFRYKMRRSGGLTTLPPRFFQVEKEAVEEAEWDPRVLSKTQYAAQGTLVTGQPFFLRALLYVPWYPWSRHDFVVYVESPGGPAIAHIDTKTSTVFPAERAPAIEEMLPDVQTLLRERGGGDVFIGPTYIQASLRSYQDASDIKEIIDFALCMQSKLESYRLGGYRGESPGSASVDQIEETDALVLKAWRKLPLPS